MKTFHNTEAAYFEAKYNSLKKNLHIALELANHDFT